MKKLLFVAVIMLSIEVSSAQSYQPQAKTDHLALLVTDLNKSAEFYTQILGLNEITNQTKKSNIRWFAFADGVELHLINRSMDGVSLKKDIHLAVAINNLTAFTKMLDEKNVYYENWSGEANTTNERPDGVTQVYIQDPDGYWIEVNDADRF